MPRLFEASHTRNMARIFVALFATANLYPLISFNPLAGWDTIGHRHLFEFYYSLFLIGESTGYDPGWFQGYPAFYFYPPLLYLCMSLLHAITSILGNHSLDFSFNLSILLVILFYLDSLFTLTYHFTPEKLNTLLKALIATSCSFLYFLYAGEGLQAAGIVGAIEGTFNSTFGHALALRILYALDRFRLSSSNKNLAQLVIYTSLLFYTHYLSLVFLTCILIIYAFFFWRQLNWSRLICAIAMVGILTLPIIVLYLKYSPYRSGMALNEIYPAMTSWIGMDFFYAMQKVESPGLEFIKQIFVQFKWIQFGALALAIIFFVQSLRGLVKNSAAHWILTSAFFLCWASQDSSLITFFPSPGIHWYRTFDLFLSFFIIIVGYQSGLLLVTSRQKQLTTILCASISILILIRVLTWSPWEHQGIEHTHIEDYAGQDFQDLDLTLAKLTPHSLILPEVIRDKKRLGSPHALDLWIQKHKHRNALGLTIESAPSARIFYTYIDPVIPWIFRWGIGKTWDKTIQNSFQPSESEKHKQFLFYLKRSGIQYILGQSLELRSILEKNPESFRPVLIRNTVYLYHVSQSSPTAFRTTSQPIGLLDYEILRESKTNNTETYFDFLLLSNLIRVKIPESNAPIINLNHAIAKKTTLPLNKLSAIIIYNTTNRNGVFHPGRLQIPPELPVYLVNLRSMHPDIKVLNFINNSVGWQDFQDYSDHTTALVQKTSGSVRFHTNQIKLSGIRTLANQPCQPIVIHTTYFPDLAAFPETVIYQTDNNQMYLCRKGEAPIILKNTNTISGWMFVIMLLLVAGAGLINIPGVFDRINHIFLILIDHLKQWRFK